MSASPSRSRAKKPTGGEFGHVPKNAKGGVLVTEEEIRLAFEFLDADARGTITAGALKKRLSAFYPDMPMKEYKFLMQGKRELTQEDLRTLLLDNEIQNFDPVVEAFRAYDTENTGFMSPATLRRIFESLGYGTLSDDELAVLVNAADGDQDGKISLSDFRNMIGRTATKLRPPPPTTGGGAGAGGPESS